ncbi:hypothetical protein CFC21_017754 [Triticum aestivum]|uniref:DUF1618 domain-containing protein n=3 Tax=Triticum TaxID=4564 RepID=A0A9R1NXC1_TRITD|nr:hypothetical protein CFC21_017754 [Triticum aestivum]VAH32929.1 unnamed protein product [Triticum turgidum subsp. durum]
MAAACVLVDSAAYIDDTNDSTNGSTAQEFTSTGNRIVVSLWPASPPIPSRLTVHGKEMHPGHDFFQEPKILCAADCFFVLRIAIGRSPPPRYITQKMSDYFIYQPARSTGPSLTLLPHPHPHLFEDDEVGVLRRGDHFTIAVLSQASYFNFVLYLFKSEDWYWTYKEVLVDPPQIPFPMPLPPDHGRGHFQHVTNSVITIGSRGAIGWVDLWQGILFYDVLGDNEDKIHLVTLPVRPGSHGGKALDCCPKPYRSVSVVGDCLKFVELEPSGHRLPGKDPETRGPKLKIDDWTLTTYTNCKITGDPEDWKPDFTVNASAIRIDATMRSVLLRCGMLLRKTHNSSEAAERNLQNLWTCQPVVGLNDEGTIVYLITRVKFQHPKAWLLAVDMANNQVRGMAMIETERSTALSLNYFPCRISSPAS